MYWGAGATRMRRRLDWLLQKLLTCPLEEIQPEVQALLRLALYEMTELGVPDHATNAHVELAKSAINRSCAALVNGMPLSAMAASCCSVHSHSMATAEVLC